MSFKVTIEPSGHEFYTVAGESLLEAAERQGINLPPEAVTTLGMPMLSRQLMRS